MTPVAKAAIVVAVVVLVPLGTWYAVKQHTLPPETGAEHRASGAQRTASDVGEASRSETLIIDSYSYDVYLGGRRLVYQRTGCADAPAPFFLHAVPLRQSDLSAPWTEHGFENLDFDFNANGGRRVGDFCVVERQLPDYPIVRLRTGQYDSTSMERHWVEFVNIWAVGASTPFKVFRWDERGLVYKKGDCKLEDLRHPFYLRVLPERVPGDAESPPVGSDGYANLDFEQAFDDVQRDDGACAFEREVPFAFRQLRTGQYDADTLNRYWQRDIGRV